MKEKQKYEEVCEMEDIEEEEIIPTQFEDTELEAEVDGKHQKDTSHQMEICHDV